MEGEEFNQEDLSPEAEVENVEQRPVKMRVEKELALRWIKCRYGIEAKPGERPPRQADEWFRNFNFKFSELVDATIEEDKRMKTHNNPLFRFEQAETFEEKEEILEEIEQYLYHPIHI